MGASASVSATSLQQAHKLLLRIQTAVEHCTVACLLSPDGKIISHCGEPGHCVSDSLLDPVAKLKQAALAFGQSVNSECAYVHVRGHNHTLSFYSVADKLVCLWSESHSACSDHTDSHLLQESLEPILAEMAAVCAKL